MDNPSEVASLLKAVRADCYSGNMMSADHMMLNAAVLQQSQPVARGAPSTSAVASVSAQSGDKFGAPSSTASDLVRVFVAHEVSVGVGLTRMPRV